MIRGLFENGQTYYKTVVKHTYLNRNFRRDLSVNQMVCEILFSHISLPILKFRLGGFLAFFENYSTDYESFFFLGYESQVLVYFMFNSAEHQIYASMTF